MTSASRKYFFVRLLPPRPSFPFDMSDAERAIMQQHVVYWTERLQEGMAVAFGPVADPKGAWGLGVVECESAEQVKTLEANDPAIKAGLGFSYEVLPMLQAIVRPR
jgi:uncharacterized protein YciI